VVHVPHPSVDDEQYASTMRAFHHAILVETQALRAELAARGAGRAARTAGAMWTRETRWVLDDAPAARAYYTEMGLPLADPPRLYELSVGLDGAVNLDTIEHVVRDRIGISRGVHGTHVQEHVTFVASVRNLVHATGRPDGSAHGWIAALACTKPFGEAEDFRRAFREAIARAHARHAKVSMELWERKLGLGRGLDVQLRVSGLASPDALEPVLADLTGAADRVVTTSLDAAVRTVGHVLPLDAPSHVR
jgi:hypothetical protein